jgi:hypothetical protein
VVVRVVAFQGFRDERSHGPQLLPGYGRTTFFQKPFEVFELLVQLFVLPVHRSSSDCKTRAMPRRKPTKAIVPIRRLLAPDLGPNRKPIMQRGDAEKRRRKAKSRPESAEEAEIPSPSPSPGAGLGTKQETDYSTRSRGGAEKKSKVKT